VIILLLPKDDKPVVFECQVCHDKFSSSLEALQCPEIHGYPKEAFKLNDKVEVIGGKDKGFVGVISNINYAKPGNLNREPHSVLYTIRGNETINNHKVNSDNRIVFGHATARAGEIKLCD